MKILVCVKQVPDVDLVKMDPETGNLIRAGVPTMLNPLDGNALEAALRVKEKYGAEVTVITMGPPMAESTLRDCLAVGADKAVLISRVQSLNLKNGEVLMMYMLYDNPAGLSAERTRSPRATPSPPRPRWRAASTWSLPARSR